MGLALTVMMALASGQVRAGRPERMRSLYGPVPPAFAGAGFGPTPADRLAALPSSPGPVPRHAPAEAGGPARARRPDRRILPLYEGPMRGLRLLFGLDCAPSHPLARPTRPSGLHWTAPKTPQRTCLTHASGCGTAHEAA